MFHILECIYLDEDRFFSWDGICAFILSTKIIYRNWFSNNSESLHYSLRSSTLSSSFADPFCYVDYNNNNNNNNNNNIDYRI